MADFSQNLKRARTSAGLTQEQLAAKLPVTRQSVSSWELGRTEPDLKTVGQLAELLDTDVGTLLGAPERPQYPRFQKRFVLGFAVCAGLLLLVFGLELRLFAYWRSLHNYDVALYASLWKSSTPGLIWYLAGLGAVCFFAWWAPVRCGKRARLALLFGALLLGVPVLVLMAQYLAVVLGGHSGSVVWIWPFFRWPAGRAAMQMVFPVLSGICTGLFACSERSI